MFWYFPIILLYSISSSLSIDNNTYRLVKRNAFSYKYNSNLKFVIPSVERPAHNNTDSGQVPRPRFNIPRIPNLKLDATIYECNDSVSVQCNNLTREFSYKVIQEFRKSLDQSLAEETNYYGVNYKHQVESDSRKQSVSSRCLLLKSRIRTLRRKHLPKKFKEFGRLFPDHKIFETKPRKSLSCAIVSSAGSLRNSSLGRFIDAHDIVLRFNNAPTSGYEVDVGKKTTIRVLNSQVISKSEYNFLSSPMFQNVTIAAWDPGKYNISIEEWLERPDFDMFTNYKKYMEQWPHADVFLINPRSIWNLWRTIRIFTQRRILKNPPSSGFIGLGLLLPICGHIDFVEYIPSTRLNGFCHYYSNEFNPSCTFGSWHPLAAEKLMALDMNSMDLFNVYQRGILRIVYPQCN